MEYGDIFDNSLNAIMAKVAQDMAKSTTASRYANGIMRKTERKPIPVVKVVLALKQMMPGK
ncbi:Uncharacterised protein [Raoultella terrigena]|uniref:Uncharacterized protein n=1 Tax=Raoultella terrigena TaxID=577 RepID=A0A4U9D7F1_RAOTE|nr:Uncharacterised protein [Raoultella terrigena]